MSERRRLFGTDGVRGVANDDLTCSMAYSLGQSAVTLLGKDILIGKDTRKSGDMLEAALISGIMSAGGTAHLAGVIPTPAVALLTRAHGYDGGAVISASHNAPQYNGIKFFDAKGFKLDERTEQRFEDLLQAAVALERSVVDELLEGHEHLKRLHDITGILLDSRTPKSSPIVGAQVGKTVRETDARESYIAHAVGFVDDVDFSGLTIAVDCAHGASCDTTPAALARLGANLYVINDSYSGDDINVDCGSTHMEALSALVREHRCDLGIAHDGDADRLLAVDAEGNTVDGDMIEAICAVALKEQGKLAHDTVVSTVMANLGFKKAMDAHQIKVVETPVGDKNVLAAMREGGYVLGGEQSGHTIFLECNSTGDGLITALQLIAQVKRTGKPLSELAAVMTRYPQVLINVQTANKGLLGTSLVVRQAVREAEAALKGDGRVLVRASGTEPLVRVMVEASDQETADAVAKRVAAVVEEAL